MTLNKILMVAALTLGLAMAGTPAVAQQPPSGTIAGMTPAMAAAAGLGLVIAGVLIADQIGSSGSGPLFPPVDDVDDDDYQDDTVTTTTTTTTTDGVVTTTTTTN